jgi:hypothetical protein
MQSIAQTLFRMALAQRLSWGQWTPCDEISVPHRVLADILVTA